MRVALSLRDLDWLLLGVAVLLAIVGVAEVYSTTAHSTLASEYRKQFEWVALGVLAALAVSQVDYRRVVEHAPVLYLASLAALGAVLALGRAVARTHRWLTIGGQSLQVSELVKLVIIILVAFYLGRRNPRPVSWKDLVILGFVPVSHADFIFAAFSEEQGFVGAVLILLLYLVLLLRLLDGAQWAPDGSGAYLVAGLAAVLFFQVAVNVGMMIGWLPITGIPLPLMSQGGSSAFATFVGLGLALSVKRRRFVN